LANASDSHATLRATAWTSSRVRFYPSVRRPAARLARVPVTLASIRDMATSGRPRSGGAARRVPPRGRVLVNAGAVAARLRRPGTIATDRDRPERDDLASFRDREPPADLRRELGFPEEAHVIAVCRG